MQVQIAEKAAECVTRSITALGRQGDDSLVRLVLADEQVCGDLLECLSGLKQRESQNPALRVEALTRVAATVSLFSFRQGIVICTRLDAVMCAAELSNCMYPAQHLASKHHGGYKQCTGLHSMHACMQTALSWSVSFAGRFALVEIKEHENVKPSGVITGLSVPRSSPGRVKVVSITHQAQTDVAPNVHTYVMNEVPCCITVM